MPFLLFVLLLSCSRPADETTTPKTQPDSPVAKDTLISPPEEIKPDSTPQEETAPEPPISHPEAIGLWMVPNEKARLEGNGWMAIPMPAIFKYDGRYLTLQIMMVNDGTLADPPKWPSKDGYYKLKTEWHGDSLFYHSPFKRTEFMARFADSVFLRTEVFDNIRHTWEFERITEKEVEEYLRPILKKRKVLDYSLL